MSWYSTSSAMRSAPMWVGSTTWSAPACSSLRSVEGNSPRAMIVSLSLSERADRVMKTLAASSGSTVASARARSMPAARSTFSSVASPSRFR